MRKQLMETIPSGQLLLLILPSYFAWQDCQVLYLLLGSWQATLHHQHLKTNALLVIDDHLRKISSAEL